MNRARLSIDMKRKAYPLLAKLARDGGIVASTLDDEGALVLLRDMLDDLGVQPSPDGAPLGTQESRETTRREIAATAARPVLVTPDERFASKTVSDAGAMRIAVIRSAFTLCVTTIEDACKPGRYLALCITAMEQACMWAIKSVSHEPRD